jgi:peptidoglycan/LPS O-acetylase OafA/YrhL
MTEFLQQVVVYSGRGPSFKGNYEMCIDHPSLKYAVVELGVGGVDAGAYVGVCVPHSCDDAMVTNGI